MHLAKNITADVESGATQSELIRYCFVNTMQISSNMTALLWSHCADAVFRIRCTRGCGSAAEQRRAGNDIKEEEFTSCLQFNVCLPPWFKGTLQLFLTTNWAMAPRLPCYSTDLTAPTVGGSNEPKKHFMQVLSKKTDLKEKWRTFFKTAL